MNRLRRVVTVAAVCIVIGAGAVLASEVRTFRQRLGVINEDVVRPGKILMLDLRRAVATGDIGVREVYTSMRQDTYDEMTGRADALDATAWQLVLDARQQWFATQRRSDFTAYVSAVHALEAVDYLAQFPRGGGSDYDLKFAGLAFNVSSTAAQGARYAEELEKRHPYGIPMIGEGSP